MFNKKASALLITLLVTVTVALIVLVTSKTVIKSIRQQESRSENDAQLSLQNEAKNNGIKNYKLLQANKLTGQTYINAGEFGYSGTVDNVSLYQNGTIKPAFFGHIAAHDCNSALTSNGSLENALNPDCDRYSIRIRDSRTLAIQNSFDIDTRVLEQWRNGFDLILPIRKAGANVDKFKVSIASNTTTLFHLNIQNLQTDRLTLSSATQSTSDYNLSNISQSVDINILSQQNYSPNVGLGYLKFHIAVEGGNSPAKASEILKSITITNNGSAPISIGQGYTAIETKLFSKNGWAKKNIMVAYDHFYSQPLVSAPWVPENPDNVVFQQYNVPVYNETDDGNITIPPSIIPSTISISMVTPTPTATVNPTATPQVYLENVYAISSGGHNTCTIKVDRTVVCLGNNDYGQIGDNTVGTSRLLPTVVQGVGGVGVLSSVSTIVNGTGYACALKNDGTVVCWGQNNNGQIGDNTSGTNRLTPVAVKDVGGSGTLSSVSAISAGQNHVCAVKTDGSVVCWGSNTNGQIGDGTSGTNRLSPVVVKGAGGVGTLASISSIKAAGFHTCALKTDQTVVCWGNNTYGNIGNGGSGTLVVATPVVVKGVGGVGTLSSVSAITVGQGYTCALKTDSSVVCWGSDNYGGLGDNTSGISRVTPVVVKGVGGVGTLTSVTAISAGQGHTCALLSDKSVNCWGYNQFGQIGDNTSMVSRLVPVVVKAEDGSASLSSINAISTGQGHTCALRSDSTVSCWGFNFYGTLGDNTSGVNRLIPVRVRNGL